MSLEKISSGDEFLPSAEMFNTIIDAANIVHGENFDGSHKFNPNVGDADLVLIKNNTGADLEEFHVVKLGSIVITPENSEADFKYETPLFYGEEIDGDDNTFVITQEPIEKNKIGYAKITGVTAVKLTVNQETDNYASIDKDAKKLQSATDGSVKILWKQAETGEKWAIVLLASSDGGNNYKSYFKVSNVSDKDNLKIKIHYGYNIASTIAGVFYHGTDTVTIPAQTLTVTASGWIFLKVNWDGAAFVCNFEYAASRPGNENGTTYIEIAYFRVKDNKIYSIEQIIHGPATAPSGLL